MKKFILFLLCLTLILCNTLFFAQDVRAAQSKVTLSKIASSEDLHDVVYGKDKFVAVGNKGCIAYSTDGFSWTYIIPIDNSNLKAVTYGKNMYVAVGEKGTVMTSKDGINWTLKKKIVSTGLNDVIFAKDTFVVVGYEGTIVTSKDGESWAKINSGTKSSLVTVSSNNDVIIAAGNGFKSYLISKDGTTWSISEDDSISFDFTKIIWDSKKFMSFNSIDVYTSTDGLKWTKERYDDTLGQIQDFSHMKDLVWNGKGYIGVGGSLSGSLTVYKDLISVEYINEFKEKRTYTVEKFSGGGSKLSTFNSEDGTKWSQLDGITPNNNILNSIAYNGKTYAAVGYGGVIISSDNGKNWTLHAAMGYLEEFESNGKVFTDGKLISSDGLVWRKVPQEVALYDLICVGNKFIGLGLGAVYSSADGEKWSKISTLDMKGKTPYGIAYSSNCYVALGEFNTFFTSTDGKKWTEAKFTQTYYPLRSIVYHKGIFVAAGQYGTIATSKDGVKWKLGSLGSKASVVSLESTKNGLLAACNDGNIYVSADGTKWSKKNTGINGILTGVYSDGKNIVAIGYGGIVVVSSDGGNKWTRHNISSKDDLINIAFDGKSFLINGNSTVFKLKINP